MKDVTPEEDTVGSRARARARAISFGGVIFLCIFLGIAPVENMKTSVED